MSTSQWVTMLAFPVLVGDVTFGILTSTSAVTAETFYSFNQLVDIDIVRRDYRSSQSYGT